MGIFDRLGKIASCFGQGIPPYPAVEDYGEEEEDWTPEESARVWERTDVDSTDTKYSFPAAESFERLYQDDEES